MSRPPDDSGPIDAPTPADDIYDFADVETPTSRKPTSAPEEKKKGGPPRDSQSSTFRPAPAPSQPRNRQPVEDAGTPEEEPAASTKPGQSRKSREGGESARRKPADSSAEGLGASFVKGLGEIHLFGKVDAGTIARFSRQLGTYLDSGLPITRALTSLREQVSGTAMAPVVDRFISAVKAGRPLSDAAAKETQAFDPLFVSMLRVAEARGGLPETLKSLATLYEARQRMARQMRSALIYPTIVITLAMAAGAFLTFFVLPPMVSMLKEMTRGAELPAPTRLLVAITDFVTTYGWWLFPLIGIALWILLPRYYRTESGKRLLDPWILRIPVMGKLIGTIETARMARTLGDLLGAGVPPDPSLELTADVLQFTPFQDAMDHVREEVNAGSEFTPALKDTRRFNSDVIGFLETGEETGSLPESLHKVAREYEERAEHMVKNLGSLLQPLFFLILGGIVGFIVIAFVMAYVAIIGSLVH